MTPEFPFVTRTGGARTVSAADLDRLEGGLAGGLIRPDDPRYDGARRVWNGLIDRRPGTIVRCAGEADVSRAVAFARDRDLALAVRAGGHNVAGRAVADGALVIDLSPMRRATLGADGLVQVDGGATLGDVDAATLPHGRAAPLGVVPATGVAGLTLHGGYGWLARKHGLTIDNLVAARVVTADGTVHRASEDDDPDLLWALRGGGGNFGVVTSFELRTHPIEPQVRFSMVVYPLDQAAAVLRTFRAAIPASPEPLASLAILWSVPELPEIPAARHGEPGLILVSVWTGPPTGADAALRPLREAGRPLADVEQTLTFAEAQRFFADEYPDGRLYYWKSLYLEALEDRSIAALVDATTRRPSPLSTLETWPLGGAVARVDPEATAFAHRQAPWMIGLESNWVEPGRTRENVDFTRDLHERLAAGGTGAGYLNFPGFAEGGEDFVRAAYGPNYERLRRLKARHDPDNLFRGNFNIVPAGSPAEETAQAP